MLADTWNAVKPTIVNCFKHAFGAPGRSIDATPDCLPTEDHHDESQVLFALKAHNIAANFNSYAGIVDDLWVYREDTVNDLVREMLPAQHSSRSEEEPEPEV